MPHEHEVPLAVELFLSLAMSLVACGFFSSGIPSTIDAKVDCTARSLPRFSATGTKPFASSSLSSAARRCAATVNPTVTANATSVTANDSKIRVASVRLGFGVPVTGAPRDSSASRARGITTVAEIEHVLRIGALARGVDERALDLHRPVTIVLCPRSGS